MTTTNPLMARFVGAAVACLIAPEAQSQFENCLNQAASTMNTPAFAEAVRADTGDFWAFAPDSYMAQLRPYLVKDGILQIPVKGVLLHDFPYAAGGWATGYEYIWQTFKRGMGDLDVKGIALIVDSPGGQVAGCFEAADRMFALKGTKPVRGFAAENAYSAAYAVISICDSINVSRTGGVGSIGVVTGHLDVSGAMDQAGLKFTYVFAGKHKVDGNPYEPLPADVKARIQTRIDALYDVFVSTVARNRGMEEQAVRDTEALTFTAQEALSNGLADSIGALDDSLAGYLADLSTEGDDTMVDQAAHEAAVTAARTEGLTAGRVEGQAEGRTAGLADGATAERTRINAILGSDEGKDRPVAALAAALDTDLSADSAKAFLAKLPAEAAPVAAAPTSGAAFDAAMEATKVPPVGSGVGGTTEAAAEDGEDVLAVVRSIGLPGMRAAPAAK